MFILHTVTSSIRLSESIIYRKKYTWIFSQVDHKFIEGDMVYNKKQTELYKVPEGVQGNLIKETSQHWPASTVNGQTIIKVPFIYDSGVTTSINEAVNQAIDEYNTKTCVRFTPRNGEADYIKFINSDGCWSYIGKQTGEQVDTVLFHDIFILNLSFLNIFSNYL